MLYNFFRAHPAAHEMCPTNNSQFSVLFSIHWFVFSSLDIDVVLIVQKRNEM